MSYLIRYMIRLFSLAVALVVLAGVPDLQAQSINPQNLSGVRVDDLTDDQIRSFVRQAEATGMNEAQMEQMALSRGMPATEINKLRMRIEQLGLLKTPDKDVIDGRPYQRERRLGDSLDVPQKPQAPRATDTARRSQVFGASLFRGSDTRFEPNLRLPTPQNYVIGAGDQLLLDIYGYSEASHSLLVTPEGNVNIPLAGVVKVGGATIEQATMRIREKLETIYAGIRSGQTRVNISLGDIRSISVIVTGDVVKPGTYTLPSVATAFNALHASGGPSDNGSFRDIRVIRNGKTIATLDVYEFLMEGRFSNNPVLQDQDILQVPTYINRVTMEGEVKRPLQFELKETENFEDLLRYAGGFTEDAYRARVYVRRNTATGRRVEDLLSSQFSQFTPQTGDEYKIDRILERYENRVGINGAVFRPGSYELSPGLTLTMLIKKADGLREDAFLSRGYIIRLKDDMQLEQISFNVAELMAGTTPDIELKREDRVTIASLFDLREHYSVKIDGEVRDPGQFAYAEGMTLEELIMMAGGFRESATVRRIEVSRRVRNADVTSASATVAEVFQVDAYRSLTQQEAAFRLQPFDLVVVRTAPGYESQKTVRIEGEVLYPGMYTITRKDERISDLVQRAGGFTPYAYIDGSSLKRGRETKKIAETAAEKAERQLEKEEETERRTALQGLQKTVKESVDDSLLQASLRNNNVGINLSRILDRPGHREDLILEDGDILRVPKEMQTVKVGGEVLSPVTAVYAPAKGFRQYVSQAGGFSQRALKKRAYVIYANGVAKSTSRFLFFNNYPEIRPGAEIFVPQKLERQRMSTQEWVGIGTGLASITAILMTILR